MSRHDKAVAVSKVQFKPTIKRVNLRPIYSNVVIWSLETKQRLRELLISLSKSNRILENNEVAELEQRLQQMVASLSCGRKVLTKFKNGKCEIRKRQIKKLQATQMRLRADPLDCKNQVDAAFFERLKKNYKKTYIEASKNSENQISNIPADKVNVA